MNKFRTWRLFHRSERHYHKASYRLADTAQILNRLNDRRRSLQRQIAEVGRDVTACASCGACCMGEYDHHTAVDLLLRACSDRPLRGYGEIWKPKPFYRIILDNILPRSGKERPQENEEKLRGCPSLGPQGCLLEVEDRPVRCLLWTCRMFREALSEEDQVRMGELVKELDGVACELSRALRRSL